MKKDTLQNISMDEVTPEEADGINEMEEDTTLIECDHCSNDAELITTNEGGTQVYWCEVCGSITVTFDGDDNPEVRTPIGI